MRPHGAYILARYSTDNQNADSIEVQVGKCSEWCNAHSIPVLGVYADYAVSGMRDTRPQYEAMMTALRSGGADTVVIYDQSRMFRDMTLWFSFRKDLERLGVTVHSVTQPNIGGDLKNPAVFLEESVWAVFNQLHVLQTTQKVNAAKQRKARIGEHNGGIPPLGYRVVDKHLAIHEQEAAVVRRIFHEYASGQSYKSIIDGLNRDGLTTRRGKPFGRNSLHDLLHNEKYAGVLTYGGKKYRPDGTRNTHGEPDPNAIRVEDAVPPIVSREMFDAVQERMTKNKHAQGGRPGTKRGYPLKGKVFCGLCKSAVYVSTSKQIYDYYKCGGRKNGIDCEGVIYSVDKLEDTVARILRDQFSSPTLTDTLVEILRAEARKFQGDAVARCQCLHQQELDLSRKLDNATEAILDGLASPTLKKRVAELESQLTATRRELKSLRAQAESTNIPLDHLRDLLNRALAPENPTDILSIVTRVELYPDHIEIYTILDPDPTKSPDYTTPGLPVTITPGTPSGVPTIIVTADFLKFVVAR